MARKITFNTSVKSWRVTYWTRRNSALLKFLRRRSYNNTQKYEVQSPQKHFRYWLLRRGVMIRLHRHSRRIHYDVKNLWHFDRSDRGSSKTHSFLGSKPSHNFQVLSLDKRSKAIEVAGYGFFEGGMQKNHKMHFQNTNDIKMFLITHQTKVSNSLKLFGVTKIH